MEPFMIRALAAGLGLAVVAAPLGCFVVWNRMAYFGETIAQAGLIGIALGMLLKLDLTLAVLAVAILTAGLLILLGRQKLLPLDSILGIVAHAALALGVVATALVKGPSVDLVGYLFGDILSVTGEDLWWVFVGGSAVLATLWWIWQPLLALAVHEELAAAEGVPRDRTRAIFIVLLAVTVAVAMKVIGILLIVAFLIMPAAAARVFARTPEQMALLAAGTAVIGVVLGLMLSLSLDVPGGPAIVLVLAAAALGALALAGGRRRIS
jgi:zinc transport system permease protein